MPTVSITNPTSGLVAEGANTTVMLSLQNTGYSFERPTTLHYRVSWDFYDQGMWQYFSGNGHMVGCGCENGGVPPLSQRIFDAGSVTFTPNGTLSPTFTIPPDLANALHDPQRFIRIDFDWDEPSTSYLNGDYFQEVFPYPYPNPQPFVADIADDTPVPAISSFTLNTNSLFEGEGGSASIVFDHGWSIPRKFAVTLGNGTANAFDLTSDFIDLGYIGNSNAIVLQNGQKQSSFFFRVQDHDAIEQNETLSFHLLTDWGASRTSTTVNIIDVNGSPTWPMPQTATFTVPNDRVVGEAVGQIRYSSSLGGSVTYTTDGPFSLSEDGTLIEYTGGPLTVGASYSFNIAISFVYSGIAMTNTGQYTIDITQGNRAPIFLAQNVLRVVENATSQTIVGQIGANDPDGDDVRYSIVGGTGVGFFSVDTVTGLVSTTPTFSGNPGTTYSLDVRAFDRTASDPRRRQSNATISVSVFSRSRTLNLPPVTVGDVASVATNAATYIDVLANDGDIDGDTLSGLRIVNPPARGTAVVMNHPTSGLPVIRYTAAAGQFGTESFAYAVTDSQGQESIGVVTVNVTTSDGWKRTKVLFVDAMYNPYFYDHSSFGNGYSAPNLYMTSPVGSYYAEQSWGAFASRLSQHGYVWDVAQDPTPAQLADADIIIRLNDNGVLGIYRGDAEALGTYVGAQQRNLSNWFASFPATYSLTALGLGDPSGNGYWVSWTEDEWIAGVPYQQVAVHPYVREILGWGTRGAATYCGCIELLFFPTAFHVEQGSQSALLYGGNILADGGYHIGPWDQTSSSFPLFDKILDTPKLKLSGVGSVPRVDQTVSVPAYAAMGHLVATLPAIANATYVLTGSNASLFSWNGATREVRIVDATLLKRGMRQQLTFDVMQNGSKIRTELVTVLVNWPDNSEIDLKSGVSELQISTSALPLFSWTAVAGAVSYQLDVQGISPTQPDILIPSGINATGFQSTIPMREGTYTARVRASLGGGQFSTWSPIYDFRVLLATEFSGPENQVNSSDQQVNWLPVSGVPKYELEIRDVATNSITTVVTNNAQFDPALITVDGFDEVHLPDGDYEVRVRALNTSNVPIGAWNGPYSFIIDFTPEITGLAAVSLVADPTFTWQSIAGADRYQIQVERVLVGGGTTVVFDVNNVALTSYHHNVDLLEGNYTVRVRALDQVPGQTIASKWSTVRSFTVDVNQSPTTEAFVPAINSLLESNGSALTTRQELGRFDVVDDLDGTILVTVNSTAGTPAFFESQPTLISTVVNGNERRLTYAVYLNAGMNINRDAPALLTSLSATIDINDNDPLLPATPDASLSLTVTVNDRNDSAPVLNGTPALQAHLPEDADLGDLFGSVPGVDADTGANYTYTWQIAGAITGADGQNYPGLFELIGDAPNLTTGAISARIRVAQNVAFDFDSPTAPKSFVLHNVTLHDGVATSNPVDVTVVLDDVNDNAPVVPGGQFISVPENAAINAVYGTFSATDLDTTGTYTWSLQTISGGTYTGPFSIITTGAGLTANIRITDNTGFDFESTQSSYPFRIVVSDGLHSSWVLAEVRLTDVNDTKPEIRPALPVFEISEDAANGAIVQMGGNDAILTVFDPDTTDNFRNWRIVGNGNVGGVFRIVEGANGDTAQLVVDNNARLDFETRSNYDIEVQVFDGINWSDPTTVRINVLNVVEPPKVSVQILNGNYVQDNSGAVNFGVASLNEVVTRTFVVTNHGDAPLIVNPVAYSAILGSADGFYVTTNFTSNQSVGPGVSASFIVTMNTTTEQILRGTISFVTNDANHNSFDFEVSGEPVDNLPPVISDQAFSVAENTAAGTLVGTLVASDPNNDPLGYVIASGNSSGAFDVEWSTGKIFVKNAALLNFESTKKFLLQVRVIDRRGLTDTATVTINVTNVNEAPVIKSGLSVEVFETDPVGMTVGQIDANSPDGAGVALTYSITAGNSSALFGIDATTGQVTIDQSLFGHTGSYSLTVTVTDPGGRAATTTATVVVVSANGVLPQQTNLGVGQYEVSHTSQLRINPFASLAMASSQPYVLALKQGAGSYLPAGSVLNLNFGTLTVNSDLTVTYDPADDLKTRTTGSRLSPRTDAFGSIYQYAGTETTIQAYALLPKGTDLNNAVVVGTAPLEFIATNSLPVFIGDRIHAASNSGQTNFKVPSLIHVDYSEYLSGVRQPDVRFDISDLFSDPDGDAVFVSSQGVVSGAAITATNTVKLPVAHHYRSDGLQDFSRYLVMTIVDGRFVELHNELRFSEANNPKVGLNAGWDDAAGSSTLRFRVDASDGQLTTSNTVHNWTTEVPVRPRNLTFVGTTSWSNSVLANQFTDYVERLTPSAVVPDSAVLFSPNDWQIVAETVGTQQQSNSFESVAGRQIDLNTGTLLVDHALLLDQSGGASELSIPGLLYDSSTVVANSFIGPGASGAGPVIRAVVQRLATTVMPTSIKATLRWNRKDSAATSTEISSTTTFSIPAGDASEEYVLSIRPASAPKESGIYTWKLELEFDNSTSNPMTITKFGETPVIVRNASTQLSPVSLAQQPSPFGNGWELQGVPRLFVDTRGVTVHSFRLVFEN